MFIFCSYMIDIATSVEKKVRQIISKTEENVVWLLYFLNSIMNGCFTNKFVEIFIGTASKINW